MTIKDYKCKCGHNDFFFADKGNQKGIYCSYCGKWLKWADKDEQNLKMNQYPIDIDDILDQIQTDIDVKAVHFLKLKNMQRVHGLEDALEIIDKHRKVKT